MSDVFLPEQRPAKGSLPALASLLLPMIIASTLNSAESLWQPAAAMPTGVAGFVRSVVAGHLLVAGGTAWAGDMKQLPDHIWHYDPAADRWHEAGRLTRSFAFGVSANTGTGMLLLGGDDGLQTRADALSISQYGAAPLSVALPKPLVYAGFVSVQGCAIYILGGSTAMRDLGKTTASFLRLDPFTGETELLPEYPGGPIIHAALVAMEEYIYVFPGGMRNPVDGAIRNSRTVWRYLLATRQWQPLAPYPLEIRGLAACALDARFILLTGGLKTVDAVPGKNEITGACYLYDARDDSYAALPALPHAAMLMGLELLNGRIYAFGGEDGTKHRSAFVFHASVPRLISAGQAAASIRPDSAMRSKNPPRGRQP